MKPRFVSVGVWLAVVLLLSACRADAQSVDRISLDFPYGETRLLVRRGGEARLFYAALPEALMVEDGVFDFDMLFDQLQTRIHDVVPAEERTIGKPFGMVTVWFRDGGYKDYLLYDGDFAESLFVEACRNLMPGREISETLYKMVCEERQGTP